MLIIWKFKGLTFRRGSEVSQVLTYVAPLRVRSIVSCGLARGGESSSFAVSSSRCAWQMGFLSGLIPSEASGRSSWRGEEPCP